MERIVKIKMIPVFQTLVLTMEIVILNKDSTHAIGIEFLNLKNEIFFYIFNF
jgi:hypothetical protein